MNTRKETVLMIKVIAKNFFKEEKLDEVIDIAKQLVEKTRHESGNISYEVFQDIKDKSILTFVEEWQDEVSLNSHINSPHFKTLIPKISEFSIKESDMNVYNKLI
jgi:quinol monooxygenase YgiN